jgi:nitroreductase
MSGPHAPTVDRTVALWRIPLDAAWRIKTRLQFTGWLQYAPTGAAGALTLAVGASLSVVVASFATTGLMMIGALFLLEVAFELVTLRFGFRPPEGLPQSRERLDVFDLMRSRRSCRSFQPRNLTPEHREILVERARRETAQERLLGTRPIRFEYVAAPLTVWPVVGAHEFLVAIAPHEYDRMATIDVGRSLQRLVLAATRMGIATCWIGPGADQHLGQRFDPTRDHIICVCAIGYESRLKPLFVRLMQFFQHRRLPLSALFYASSKFDTPLDTASPPFDRFGRTFEACQWSPSSFNEQTTRCAAVVEHRGNDARVLRFDFFAATASRYYAAVALGIWLANWEAGCEAMGVPGHFAVLTRTEQSAVATDALPRYDVSWIPD